MDAAALLLLAVAVAAAPNAIPEAGREACNEHQLQCVDDRRCIPLAFECDGKRDCRDGSDEEDCSGSCNDYQFECDGDARKCIPLAWTCNGVQDCSDNFDEIACTVSADELKLRKARHDNLAAGDAIWFFGHPEVQRLFQQAMQARQSQQAQQAMQDMLALLAQLSQ